MELGNLFDIDTLTLSYILFSVVFSIILLHIHFFKKKSFTGNVELAVSLAVLSLGMLLNTYRFIISAEFSIVFSLFLGIMGFMFLMWGVRKFENLSINYKRDFIILLLFVLSVYYFVYINNYRHARLIFISGTLLYYSLNTARLYFVKATRNTMFYLLSTILFMFIAYNAFRVLFYIFYIGFHQTFNDDLIEILWFINIIVTEIVMVVGIVIQNDNREIDQRTLLLSVLGHDLKSPLITINNMSTLILEQDISDELRNMTRMCNNAAHNGMNLIHNIIEWNTIRSFQKKNNSSFMSFDFKDNIEIFFGPQVETQEISLQISCAENFPIDLDERMLNTILRNIIGNAVQYSGVNQDVKVEIDKKDSAMEIAVSDNGPGIPDDQKIRLLKGSTEAFYKSRTTKGSGLGFYLVSTFMRSLNGTIQVEENSPKGTIIRLQIPL